MSKTKAQLEREIRELYAAMTALEKTARRQQGVIDQLRIDIEKERIAGMRWFDDFSYLGTQMIEVLRQRDQYRNRALALIRKTYKRIDGMWIKSVSMLVRIMDLQQENKSLKVKLTELMSKPPQ